jgi:hypothetical protein
VYQPLHPFRLAYMRLDDDSPASRGLNVRRGLLGALAMSEIVDRHICAVTGQFQRDRAADAPPTAGDDCGPAAQNVEGVHSNS